MIDPAQFGARARGAHSTTNRLSLFSALGCGAMLAGVLAYIVLMDPHQSDSVFPMCPFRLLTGWNCPLCGGLRMTHDLLHGDLAAAATDNVFALVGIPVLTAWILLRRNTKRPALPFPATVVLVVAAIAWTVLRNLAGFPLVPTVLTG